MEKIRLRLKETIKQLFCKHENAGLLVWQWTHGVNGNEPAFIVANYKCDKCGKIIRLQVHGKDAKEFSDVMGRYKYGDVR